MAAAKNVGNAFGFNVHVNEDSNPEDITKEGHLVRDVLYGSNFLASHLVHFYQLAALDFIDPAAVGLDKPPFAPRYGPGPAAASYPYYYRIPANISTYLVGQYVHALQFRRQCNQIGAIWGGRAPFVQGLTPGGASTSVTSEAVAKSKELLYGPTGDKDNPDPGSIMAFIGKPTDFAAWIADTGGDTGKLPIIGDGTYGGTMLFDVVAVAMFYAEYFWIGNAYERFLAYGVFERGDDNNPLGDKRLFSRGRKRTGQQYSAIIPPATKPPEWFPAEQEMVHESVAKSYYSYVNEGTIRWRHPWKGQTYPKPGKAGSYSWVKSPRYKDTTDPLYAKWVPYEAGPLARMMVNGDYYAGFLYDAGYTAVPNIPSVFGPLAGYPVPQYGAMGPDLSAAWPTGGPNLSSIAYNGDSCLDRYAARQLEAYKIARALADWLDELDGSVGTVTSTSREIPNNAYGYGWTEAPRGALGHWIKIKDKKIQKYQCVVPSTWNASPRDALGRMGPAEKAMKGIWIRDTDHPLEVLRVSHSWDFCTACAVHLVSKKNGKKEEKVFKMDATL